MLSEVHQLGGFDLTQVMWLFVLGFLALIPTLFKSKLEHTFDEVTHTEVKEKED